MVRMPIRPSVERSTASDIGVFPWLKIVVMAPVLAIPGAAAQRVQVSRCDGEIYGVTPVRQERCSTAP